MNYNFKKEKIVKLTKKYNRFANRHHRAKNIREIIFTLVILSLFLVLANTFSQNQSPNPSSVIQSEKTSEQKTETGAPQPSQKDQNIDSASTTENTNSSDKIETTKPIENVESSQKTEIQETPETNSPSEESIENAIKMDEYYKNKLASFDAFKNRQEELKLKEEELKQKERELKLLQDDVEKQIAKYEKLKKEVAEMLVQVDAQRKKKIAQLVSVYSGIKAEEAAKILTDTDEDTTIEILLGMEQKKSSKILENMPKEKAVTLSEKIAQKR